MIDYKKVDASLSDALSAMDTFRDENRLTGDQLALWKTARSDLLKVMGARVAVEMLDKPAAPQTKQEA